METSLSMLAGYAMEVPFLVIWTIGIILSLKAGQKMAATAMGMFIFTGLVNMVLNIVFQYMIMHGDLEHVSIGWAYSIKGFIFMIINATAWGMILMALFGRKTQNV